MALSYPLSFPTVGGVRRIAFRPRTSVGVTVSPFTFSQQVFEHQGDLWEAMVEFVPAMERSVAEAWNAFVLSLNGRRGTFLMGDPVNTSPRGTWSGGSPVVTGAHAAGVKTLSIVGVEGRNWKAGDWFQVGSGSTTHLHKVVQDGSQSLGSPTAAGTLEIWPRLREDLADGAALVLSSPKGQWRLAEDHAGWAIDPDAPFMVEALHLVEAKGT